MDQIKRKSFQFQSIARNSELEIKSSVEYTFHWLIFWKYDSIQSLSPLLKLKWKNWKFLIEIKPTVHCRNTFISFGAINVLLLLSLTLQCDVNGYRATHNLPFVIKCIAKKKKITATRIATIIIIIIIIATIANSEIWPKYLTRKNATCICYISVLSIKRGACKIIIFHNNIITRVHTSCIIHAFMIPNHM